MSQYEEAEFLECRYCEHQCKYRGIAEKNLKSDEEYTKEFFDLFREGDLEAVADHVAKAAIEIMETQDPESLLALGLCLYVIGTNILDIPDVLRRRLGRMAKSKIRTAIKDQLGLVPKKKPKPTAAKAGAEVQVPSEVVAQEAEAEELETMPRVEEPVEVATPASYVEQWIRSDEEFLYYVDEIVQRSDNLLAIKYDLETEGFLRGLLIKILYAAKDGKGNRIMKLGIKSRVDVPYHLNVMVGKVKREIIARSIPGDLKSEQKMYKQLKAAAAEEEHKGKMDRLSLMLNRDKFLKKTISRTLILESPVGDAKDIQIPITIQKLGEEGCDLVVRTFLDETKMTPTELFINVMDGIAENMDYLMEIPEKERAETPMEKEDWFEIKVKPKMGSFSSKFIKRVALPEIPTCPHCGRPLPKSQTVDYRRCPFCYEKL
ncbi:MAG: hypothetical protein ACOC4M_04200 [Promethearchaeia archaeon]